MALMVNNIFPGELYPTETVAGRIDIFENAWPNPKQTIAAMGKECADAYSGMTWIRSETIQSGALQNFRTNYQTGMLLLFPSNYPYAHIAHHVTSGTKYAIVTWLHDRGF